MPLAILLNPSDPILGFEHMMRHRETFAVMKPLHDFSVLPYLLDPVSNTTTPVSSWNLNHQQAHDDFNQTLPGNNLDGFSLTNVTPPTITGIGISTGTTTIQLLALSGTIQLGSNLTGIEVPPGTTIVAQTQGTPGADGIYTTNQPTTVSGSQVSIQFPPYIQANKINQQHFGIEAPGILSEGNGGDARSQAWYNFLNHQHHWAAENAILPLPTTYSTSAGTGPGQAAVSNPWWWASVAPIIYPYW